MTSSELITNDQIYKHLREKFFEELRNQGVKFSDDIADPFSVILDNALIAALNSAILEIGKTIDK